VNEMVKRAPRADGQRNKVKLLKAACMIVSAGCKELYLDQVARQAGVSIATLYRHFPTREALLLEMSQQDAIDYYASAMTLLKDLPPVAALAQWLDELSQYGLVRPGMAAAFRAAADAPIGDKVYSTFIAALNSLLVAGQTSGKIRTDLSANDVLLALCGLWDLKDSQETRAQCSRLAGLLVDGLQVKTI
jgi:AcrR family transcriptional regulator